MEDQGYIGPVSLGSAILITAVWKNGSWVPTTATGTPTYRIYAGDISTTVATGSMSASDDDSQTGLRSVSITASGPTYSSGQLYTFILDATVSGVNRKQKGTFMVV